MSCRKPVKMCGGSVLSTGYCCVGGTFDELLENEKFFNPFGIVCVCGSLFVFGRSIIYTEPSKGKF